MAAGQEGWGGRRRDGADDDDDDEALSLALARSLAEAEATGAAAAATAGDHADANDDDAASLALARQLAAEEGRRTGGGGGGGGGRVRTVADADGDQYALYLTLSPTGVATLCDTLPKNEYWRGWGGPHCTLGGFVSGWTEGAALELMKGLPRAHEEEEGDAGSGTHDDDGRERMIGAATTASNVGRLEVVRGRGHGKLWLALFRSTVLDAAASTLRRAGWPNVKDNWHFTLYSGRRPPAEAGSRTRVRADPGPHPTAALVAAAQVIDDARAFEYVLVRRTPEGVVSWIATTPAC